MTCLVPFWKLIAICELLFRMTMFWLFPSIGEGWPITRLFEWWVNIWLGVATWTLLFVLLDCLLLGADLPPMSGWVWFWLKPGRVIEPWFWL